MYGSHQHAIAADGVGGHVTATTPQLSISMCKNYPSAPSDSSFFFVKSTMPSVLHCEHFSGFPPGRPNRTCRSDPHVQIFVVRLIIFSDLHSMHAVRGPPFTPNRFTLFEPHEHLPPQASSGFFDSDLRGASTRSERPQNRKRNHPRPSFPETIHEDGVKASLHDGAPRYAQVHHPLGLAVDAVRPR